jgi:hypothetical protein
MNRLGSSLRRLGWLTAAALVLSADLCPARVRMLFTWNARGQTGLAPEDSTGPSSPWIERWATVAEGARDSASIVLDLGNTLYPGYLSRFSYGSLMAEILNRAGVSARRVTARDFSQGRDRLATLAGRATYPFVCTNLIDEETGKAVFAPSASMRVGDTEVRVVAVVRPQRVRGSGYGDHDEIEIADPVESLRGFLSADSGFAGGITLCLCDHGTVSRYPELLAVPGIDLFACGVDAFSSSTRPATRMELLESGARIVYVPPFQTGIGRLDMEMQEGSPTIRYGIDTTTDVDEECLLRLRDLHRKWSTLYRAESSDTVAEMDSALTHDQASVVGNLLREKTRAEVAVFERALVSSTPLPATITVQDLDRLLNASPDLYMLQLREHDIRRADGIEGLAWIGLEGGTVEGRGMSGDHRYRVVATEAAKEAILEAMRGRPPAARARPLFVSLDEALREQLARRKRADYDFAHLRRRVRLSAGLELETSRRRVRVWNPDSVTSLPGATNESFSAWDIDLKLPLSLHNWRHELELEPRLQYAAANEEVGRNDLELTLDYTFGPTTVLKPYASARYQTYVALRPEETLPVKIRTTLGAQATLADWELRLGFGAEKGTEADEPNPFAPFLGVFRDTAETWGPGIELSADGAYSLSDALSKRGLEFFRYRDLSLEVDLESYFGSSRETARFQSELDLDVVIQLIPPLKFRIGYRLFYAHLFADGHSFYNLEPSLTIMGSYGLKW